MKTVMRIPIYLEIETDNIERSKVTKAFNDMILPEILKHFTTFGNRMNFDQREILYLQTTIGPFSCKILSEIDALVKKNP
jgi:hypothetical protein